MKKQCVLVGIVVAGALVASDAFAQHKAPNQQPPQATEAAAPAGDLALGSVRLPEGVYPLMASRSRPAPIRSA